MEGADYVNRPVQYRVSAGARVVLHDFAAEAVPVRYGAYDRVLDAVTYVAGDPAGGVAPMPGPSGLRFYLGGIIYDFSMDQLLDLGMPDPEEHSSIGKLSNGYDAIFATEFDGTDPGTLVAYGKEDGTRHPFITESMGYPYPPSGTHVCAIAYKNPSLIAVSVVGYEATGQTLLDNEILLVDTGTGTVGRVCHHGSRAQSPNNEGPMGYRAEPRLVISPSGTRILFGSDREGGRSVDTYAAELPAAD
jgi:hypothetical protein